MGTEDQSPSELVRQPQAHPQNSLIVETPQSVASVPVSTQTTVVVSNQQSALGYWGLLLSLCGVVTCGLSSIPGFLVSLSGMFSPGPKACAIWGTVLGLVGAIPFVIFVLPFLFIGLLGMLGLAGGAAMTAGAVAAGAADIEHVRSADEEKPSEPEVNEPLEPAGKDLPPTEVPPSLDEELPQEPKESEPSQAEIELEKQRALAEHNQKVARLEESVRSLKSNEPKLPVLGLRNWEASTGQTVVAKLIRINETHVKLEKEDGSQVNVERKQLSAKEQKRLSDKYDYHVNNWNNWQDTIKHLTEEIEDLNAQRP